MTEKETIPLYAVGDLMLGDDSVVFGHGIGSKLESKGRSWLFSEIRGIWKQSGIVFANLETVLSNRGMVPNDLESCELRGSPDTIESLVDAGFNFVNIANNHMLQHGKEAFFETIDLLTANGIAPVGLQSAEPEFYSQPQYFERNGLRIGLLGYSYRKERYFKGRPVYAVAEDEIIVSDIKKLKENVDCIVVSFHWGDEFISRPSIEQVRLGRRLVDSGADLILGHHPHVLQGVERYKKGVIAYSMGNFVSDMSQSGTRESMVLTCEFSKGGIHNMDYIPVKINQDYRPIVLDKSKGDKLLGRINRLSNALAEEDYSNEIFKKRRYNKEVRINTWSNRLQCYLYFVTHLWKYSGATLVASLKRFLLRRLEFFDL